MDVNRLQLQSSSSATPGDLGFKLLGESVDQPGKLARVWLRRKRGGDRHVWHRYLEPAAQSVDWEVRLHLRRGTGAMTLTPCSLETLASLSETYAFPKEPEGRDSLAAVTMVDPLFNAVRDWALAVTEA
jgi:hypothetical protein